IAKELVGQFKTVDFYTRPDREGNNPLHIAVRNGSMAFVQLLIKKCKKEAPNHQGVTPVHLAIQNNEWEILNYFLDVGAKPHGMQMQGITLSFCELAIYYGSVACVDVLFEKGQAEFERCPKEGGNILHW